MSILQTIARYKHWLHTRWPAGTVEKLPEVGENGTTNIAGVYVVGDLTGIPLLKFSAETATKSVKHITSDNNFRKSDNADIVDVAIIGGGVSGISAAIEAQKAGLSYAVFETSQTFSTVVNFPKEKPIYVYPTNMEPSGGLSFEADVKEKLLEEMYEQCRKHGIKVTNSRIEKIERSQGSFRLIHAENEHKIPTQAQRVIIAIGRSGNFRKINCPGEELPHVYNRLHDPKEFCGRNVVVIGGGDSALETAAAIACCGGHVTLSYRGKEFTRPKPENVEQVQRLSSSDIDTRRLTERTTTTTNLEMYGEKTSGSLTLKMQTTVRKICGEKVVVEGGDGAAEDIQCDVVFSMIGREAPLDFFRRSGIKISGEWRKSTYISFSVFFAFCMFLYHWKESSSFVYKIFAAKALFPFNIGNLLGYVDPHIYLGALSLSPGSSDLYLTSSFPIAVPPTYLQALSISMASPGFYITFVYSLVILIYGVKRIKRRKTPYVTWQTITLIAIQIFPLFLIPEIILPFANVAGYFDSGWMQSVANSLFPVVDYGHGREYWRAYGFIFAWPLFVYNVMTWQPLWIWFAISMAQTFILIPLMVWKWGKGAYCGWICSCGALEETLGDTHRHKMPHGPKWNRLNMVGQVILWVAFALLLLRILAWIPFLSILGHLPMALLDNWTIFSYRYIVDIFLAGVVGIAMYFWFSGRVWCRFACPLAALMHIYARFSKFRIFSEKSKCISCNVCTSVCHQGIDIMNFANKGLPMEDPECVRCSACVQQCPTGTLSFGELGKNGEVIKGWLQASPVQMQEKSFEV